MEKLEKLIAGRPVFFISPHLDDAVFSAGALISSLRQGATVITVFSDCSPPPETLSAKRFVRSCGFASAVQLFEERRREDIAVLEGARAKHVHLGFTDAAWRKKPGWQTHPLGRIIPELVHLYPLRPSKYAGRIRSEDRGLMKDLGDRLRGEIATGSVVFCPAGTGRHVDHLIVRTVCERIFPETIFWDDLPYSRTGGTVIEGRERVKWDNHFTGKQAMVLGYRTQKHAAEAVPLAAELFFMPQTTGK